ncbi:MAG TPA: anti-sigma factor [Lichenihabitans sp.]|nr:anti-sigma factor [Lichenihabitans sp.]
MTTPSDHDETRLLLSAHIDGELDAASALHFERRLAAEPDLAREREELLALRAALRKALPREAAPDGLRQALARIGGPEAVANGIAAPSWPARLGASVLGKRLGASDWRLALAACLAIGMVLGAGLTTLLAPPRAPSSVMAEVVADHLRAVMAPQPFDVASSDQHTVKPWFTGRLSFAPQVFDLASVGFDLIGGRVDVLNGQPAAALVFRHGKHVISLISQPVGPLAPHPGGNTADRGFQVRDWTVGGMRYWAVSDVAPEELDAFESAVRARLGQGD